VFFEPPFEIIFPFLPPHSFRAVILLRSALNNQIYGLIDEVGLLTAPFSDLFAAVWTFLFAQERFFNAHVTERVTTDSSSAVEYEVHAD